MRSPEIERKFNEHIDARLTSRSWSAEIACSVIARSRLERKRKMANIAALVFPLAAAAVLLIAILPFGGSSAGNGNASSLISTPGNVELYSGAVPVVADIDGMAGYFPDF